MTLSTINLSQQSILLSEGKILEHIFIIVSFESLDTNMQVILVMDLKD